VCLRTPQTAQDQSIAGSATATFQQNHDLKSVFQQVASACAGN
jgi:hypothetical protein